MGRRQGIYSHHGCQNAERWRNEKRGDEKISSFRTPGGDQATKPPFFLRSTVTCRLCLGPPSYLKGGKFTTPDSDQRRLLRIRAAKYTVDGGARGMREVFRSASWPPRLWA